MRLGVYGAAMVIAWSSAVVIAQKVTTPEELDKVMKKVQQSMGPTSKAISSGAYADAKTTLAVVKQGVVDSQAFWVEHKKDDAVKLNKESIAKIEALEKALSAPTVDAAAATTALKEVGASCRACHTGYRVQDADDNWILKPGTIGG